MRHLIYLSVTLASLTLPSPIFPQTPDELALESYEDEEIEEEDLVLESEDFDEWSDDLDTDYVVVGEEGPIPPPYPPSILDDGVYNTQVTISTEYLEAQGVDKVTIH